MNPNIFAEARNTDTEIRTPMPDLGANQIATITTLRYLESPVAGPSVIVSYTINGAERGHFIGLKKNPLYTINYGLRDLKILLGAAQGFRMGDPRTKEIDDKEIVRALSPEQPYSGKQLKLEVLQSTTKAGKSFRQVLVSPVDASTPAPAAPPPPPAAESVTVWHDFPESDQRFGKFVYDAQGNTRAK